MENLWRNGIMGVVIGDALGRSVQFEDRSAVAKHPVTDMRGHGTTDLPAGTWTDDSSLTLALLDSICKTDAIDLEHIMNNFVSWFENGEFTPFGFSFDIGLGTMRAIKEYELSGNPYTCGGTKESNNGNGSLMRIMPACLFCYEKGFDDKAAIKQIHAVGSLTHAHIRSNIACGLYYFMVKAIISGEGYTEFGRVQEGLDHGFDYYEKELQSHEELKCYDRLRDLKQFAAVPESEIKSSGYVADTLEAAVWCLITTKSFEDALLKAVNLGDDSDTVGAVTGGLAGLIYGNRYTNGIPAKWMNAIQRKEWIEALCDEVNNRLEKRVEDKGPCIGFSMDDAGQAYEHMQHRERIRDYGSICGQNILHTWDEGCRILMRCKNCGGFVLVQLSEFHGPEDDYYADYFPVAGPKEARLINEQYNGERIEKEFPHKWMIADGRPHWNSL